MSDLGDRIWAWAYDIESNVAPVDDYISAVGICAAIADALEIFADRPRGQQAGGHRCRCSHEARELATELREKRGE